jgi:hypothetical protein
MSEINEGENGWRELGENDDIAMPSDDGVPRGGILDFLSQFMSGASNAEHLYRQNACLMVVDKVFSEFGEDGLCEMMMAIDYRGNWLTDILVQASDIEDVLFKKYGVFTSDALGRAQNTEAMAEFHKKMWSLRRRYIAKIADELFALPLTENPESTT